MRRTILFSIREFQLRNLGSPVIDGKEPKHEGHQVHKGEKAVILQAFSFVTFVYFVVEKSFPVKNGRTEI